jgi:hypothetical protein
MLRRKKRKAKTRAQGRRSNRAEAHAARVCVCVCVYVCVYVCVWVHHPRCWNHITLCPPNLCVNGFINVNVGASTRRHSSLIITCSFAAPTFRFLACSRCAAWWAHMYVCMYINTTLLLLSIHPLNSRPFNTYIDIYITWRGDSGSLALVVVAI